jgi:hypothetical protein
MNDVLEMILIVPCVVVSLRCILHAIIWFEYERPIEKAWHGVGLGSGALVLYLSATTAPSQPSIGWLIATLIGTASVLACGIGLINLPFRK